MVLDILSFQEEPEAKVFVDLLLFDVILSVSSLQGPCIFCCLCMDNISGWGVNFRSIEA